MDSKASSGPGGVELIYIYIIYIFGSRSALGEIEVWQVQRPFISKHMDSASDCGRQAFPIPYRAASVPLVLGHQEVAEPERRLRVRAKVDARQSSRGAFHRLKSVFPASSGMCDEANIWCQHVVVKNNLALSSYRNAFPCYPEVS